MLWFLAGVGVNIFVFVIGNVNDPESVRTAEQQGEVFATVFVMPLMVAALFAIAPRFRNVDSFSKVFFWLSLIFGLARLGNMAG